MDRYEYTDSYGDKLRVSVSTGLYIKTDPDGVLIPLDGIDEYLTAMQALAEAARLRTEGGE